MAAYAALVSLMHIIDDLEKHHSPPVSLDKQQVQSLTENVMFLQEVLEGYTSPVADGDEADPLEMRIADAAYAAEDVIESHIVDKIQPSIPKETKIRRFINCFRGPKNDQTIKLYQDLQKVIEEMDLIKKEAEEINKVVIHDQGHRFVPTASSSSTGKNNMVGSDDVVIGIMEKLVSNQPHRQVIPIVGMGGMGKTTLARTVYSKPLIKEHFYISAWATISQQYDAREILCEILSQATKATNKKKEELRERGKDELGLELHKYLFGRRFLIVMDDMWSVDAWDKIQCFFPNNNNGSRVLVTTRISQLGSQLNNEYSHQMKFLDETSSWVLFSKTVFGENNCPPELEETGKKIVENCRGLPLSIVVVGGILRKMEHNKGHWESISENLISVVNLENDKQCLRLLKLSYNHLPVYLKPCFLYMGVFPEDDVIRVSTLVKLWVGEGFLKPIDGKSLETVAKGFLQDLVDRNLILIHHLGSTGNIKSIKVHDLLRDLCLSEVKKEGFYHVVGQRSPRGISRQRRVVIRGNTPEKEVVDELQCMSHVRSLICENGVVPECRNLKLLRTLRACLKDKHGMMNCLELQQYVNLQHLAVEVRRTSTVFASLNLHWNLHTLIVSGSDTYEATDEIWKMPQLRHIENINPFATGFYLWDPPSDAVVMENLQVLKGLAYFKCGEEVVKRIPNIKKLGVKYIVFEGMEHDYFCLSNIKCLSKLESLSFLYQQVTGVTWNSLPKLIFPHSLKRLILRIIGDLEWDGILENIGSLPHLEKLKLRGGCFGRGKWEVVEDQFSSLKYLRLFSCGNLEEWMAEASSFPCLEKLHLIELKKLEEIPSQIGYIPTLQRIELIDCSEAAVRRAKEIVDEQVEFQGDQLPFHVHVELRGRRTKQ